MAKKKIIKLNDEQYYKYIMSLKGDHIINPESGMREPDGIKSDDKEKKEK